MRLNGILSPLLAAAIASVGASAVFAEDLSLRDMLVASSPVQTLYSVDDHTTLVTTGDREGVRKELENACKAFGIEPVWTDADALSCKGSFEAAKVELVSDEDPKVHNFIITSTAPQPIAYKNQVVPSFEEITAPPNGKLSGNYSSVDVYQYMYALCKKDNGKPAVVVSKRYGRFVRLTQVNATEAFNYLMASGDGKDPWFFACEGDKKFIVEKDYTYNMDENSTFYFHPNRGLEWVDYVKSGEKAKTAALEAASMEVVKENNPVETARLIEDMAWELSTFKMDFIKTSSGSRFAGFYNDNRKKEGCDLVTIKHTQKAELEEKTYNYKVCRNSLALIDSTTVGGKVKSFFASFE